MKKAERLLAACSARGLTLATAESCTGGLVAACLTEIAGSSAVFDRGFVTYSNAAKTELLGVRAELIASLGAVSAEVAEAMAAGALAHSAADISLSVTGIAGPGGGSAAKPVGLVYFGLAWRPAGRKTARCDFEGDRSAIRLAALAFGLDLLQRRLGEA